MCLNLRDCCFLLQEDSHWLSAAVFISTEVYIMETAFPSQSSQLDTPLQKASKKATML